MAKPSRKRKRLLMAVQGLPPEEQGPPRDPEPPPEENPEAPEATTASDAQCKFLVLDQTPTCVPAPTATNTMSQEAPHPSTMEGREPGATTAPEVPIRATTCQQCDKHVKMHSRETMGQSMGAQLAQTPDAPTTGCSGSENPAMSLDNTPVATLTAVDFYTHMLAIMANFLSTISVKLGQTIDTSQETSQVNTTLL
jgi:hypothetical protein